MSISERIIGLFRWPDQQLPQPAGVAVPMTEAERAATAAQIMRLPDDEQLARFEELAKLFNGAPRRVQK